MSVTFYDSETALKNYSIDEGVYFLNQLTNNGPDLLTQSVSGPVLAGVNAATALIGAGVSLTSGIRNLKATDSINYHVQVTIANKTKYLLGIGEVDKHKGQATDNFIFPGQEGSVTFTEQIGPYSSSSSDGSIIYMALMSENKDIRFSCGVSDQTNSDTSRLIQMSHLTLNDDSGKAIETAESTHLGDANENLRFGLFVLNIDGEVFSIVCSQAGTSDQATLHMTILQRMTFTPSSAPCVAYYDDNLAGSYKEYSSSTTSIFIDLGSDGEGEGSRSIIINSGTWQLFVAENYSYPEYSITLTAADSPTGDGRFTNAQLQQLGYQPDKDQAVIYSLKRIDN